MGLDIGVIWNPPRRPQDNGVVERSQGLAKNWAEPDRCHDAAELQRRLNEEDQVQRQSYPHGSFESRLEAYPSLAHSGRLTRVWEREHWAWMRAGLPGGRDRARRVDRCGKIGLYHGKMYVGAVNRGKRWCCSSTRRQPNG